MKYCAGDYDVVVVGAGHAGCEAALAAARIGCKVLMCTISLDSVGLMPCNPNIGGTAKGHLVREIDALGGEMGVNIDNTFIQSRMLNTSKGPAVHSLRAQADKKRYSNRMKYVLETEENLTLKQIEVVSIDVENGKVKGVLTKNGAYYNTKTVILATGTYLDARIIIGEVSYSGGPNGLFPAKELTKNLMDLGLKIRRFKTGTPARVNKKTIDFSKMIEQPGDEKIVPFSFLTDKLERDQISCYLTYTNEKTHEVIRKNFHRSPMFNGSIEGVGVRYCPSIEDKINRFPDKDKHQVFLEPEGEETNEMYVSGLSTSLPEEIQIAMYRTVPGLENVEFLRTAYAIEYDCIDPQQLDLSLELKDIEGFFSAGQINGSSGYEEAAAQGIIAGINAAMKVKEKEPLILTRSDGYIGVLIDDLVTKGTNEPYRMMTSRSEYRLLLRQGNADLRLTQKGYEVGLVSEERYKKYIKRKEAIEKEINRIKNIQITNKKEVNEFLTSLNSSQLKKPISLYELIKRPELDYYKVRDLDKERVELSEDVQEEVNTFAKYEGYIDKQLEQVNQFKKFETKLLPNDIDYNKVYGLRKEAMQKLSEIRPMNIGQASRISGVSPADISVLLIYLEHKYK
ncbi:tRNA uridine-5-carboxymethylaminomethyl(34) synthesis enzyme MnmG [Clostridium cochlearium]|jgi:tRNA uridine 5-carboxymethylaminomethyl modification enzyme|uniref:tRNA uridine 5-carboxymethylaminomethyl modification enzyme MnmG n=1 Tax=Clostridium cochlearium TaxID=1494 RepID=A0A240B4N5_CLOCO|nr:tRNA uridine-5-carboxymethylaminomethyl(34) synthesis enzyme MnmG [Clostridium cochlearium]MBE6065650.1 tRNA uridine-5-carboxymethylaminomethyl(34) synthesis enzyme MnmG [Clostridium cochlearium]MBU5270197.1 tRNA uridine-5-carboxymethylaminomethyl(34) synthesis enzyme MnmG [Clostridium cochlearium]MCR1972113.1 tRNA uridine-5-carboxymethylaminomethyl(34) synthesis enzyme MnmG [Clostridium cochlearium]MDU1443876.1 tRNA uridine-5-carboxymethylaminomethyl(34) synthesis enzyme MnmG [Clostridium c